MVVRAFGWTLVALLFFRGCFVSAADTDTAVFCEELVTQARKLSWKVDPCPSGVHWKKLGQSVRGRPLVVAEFGAVSGQSGALNTTLVLSTLHGDEVTPLYVALKLVHWLREHPVDPAQARVVVAPLVNPDGFLATPRTRVNANGVDVNRNLPTRDWDRDAIVFWKKKFRSDRRRNPGSSAGSEPETAFQLELLRLYQPQKILAVHSPLNFLDYDGPDTLGLHRFPHDYVQSCKRLRAELRAQTGGYFPGSLGNYAGHERGIPTLTLELPTALPQFAERYWQRFRAGIRNMIDFEMPTHAFHSSSGV